VADADVRLRKTEKNEIFKLIHEFGLAAENFRWTEDEFPEWDIDTVIFRASVLTHLPTRYFCKFSGTLVQFSPGPDRRVQTEKHHDNWDIKLGVAGLWLEELKKEVDAPDLWSSVGKEKTLSLAASSPDIENRPFTEAEQKFIAAKLDELKGYVLEGQQFSAKQAGYVEREFVYLKESSRRFGRNDWLRVLLSVLIGQAINLALSPEKARGLLVLAGTTFQSLWGTIHGFLP
jgi:hypothetical protein